MCIKEKYNIERMLFMIFSSVLFYKLNKLKVFKLQRLNIIKIQLIKWTPRKPVEHQKSYHQAPYNYKNDL